MVIPRHPPRELANFRGSRFAGSDGTGRAVSGVRFVEKREDIRIRPGPSSCLGAGRHRGRVTRGRRAGRRRRRVRSVIVFLAARRRSNQRNRERRHFRSRSVDQHRAFSSPSGVKKKTAPLIEAAVLFLPGGGLAKTVRSTAFVLLCSRLAIWCQAGPAEYSRVSES